MISNKIELYPGIEYADFVEIWSPKYSYKYDKWYQENINKGIDNWKSFYKLYQWKNGYGEQIYAPKQPLIKKLWKLRDQFKDLSNEKIWKKFEKVFKPSKHEPIIWKIFFLHILKPSTFPIYDRHTHRSFNLLQKGKLIRKETNKKKIYDTYKNEYSAWFNNIVKQNGIEYKKFDEALMGFSQFIEKQLLVLPEELVKVEKI